MPNRLELSNQKFGRLLVCWPSGIGLRGKIYWLCACQCGKIVPKILASNLQNGNTKSCGCLQREASARNGHARQFPVGEAAFNALFHKYTVEAKRRQLEFTLNKDLFRQVINTNCHYCGVTPSQTYRIHGTTTIYRYNGIDRKDNSKGYVENNVVSCCKVCNFMKMKLSCNDFISACKRISDYQR